MFDATSLFHGCKGYASRETALRKLETSTAGWPPGHRDYIARNHLIAALPSGRFMPAVRMTGAPDWCRAEINSLLFTNGAGIALF